MKVLPRVTQPPPRPRRRRHQPRPAGGEKGYQKYRPCLRWEFAFTCAFCLLHEADLALRPPEMRRGKRDFDLEHRDPRSLHPERVNHYGNVYYCCEPCNSARRRQPLRTAAGRLLDPCRTGWATRFRLNGHTLEPLDPDDRDAIRTRNAYDLNALDKVAMRARRAAALERAEDVWREVPALIADFHARWERERDRSDLAAARRLSELLEHAVWVLTSYRAVPGRVSRACRCTNRRRYRLPRWLGEQCRDLPL